MSTRPTGLGTSRLPAAAETIVKAGDGGRGQAGDILAVEEPLEIRLAGFPVTVTMRTPGNDLDLAAGFLYGEGLIQGIADIASIAHCQTDDPDADGNVVNVNPVHHESVDPVRWQRNFVATSSCGVCGKATLDQVFARYEPIDSHAALPLASLLAMPGKMRQAQELFGQTGGVHGAGLFDLEGNLLAVREDIGRHNAVDKIIGWAVRGGLTPLQNRVLFVSSRASFEIVQKALAASIPILATVSAASTLAVQLARSSGMVLAGFVRESGRREVNVYAGADRILAQGEAGEILCECSPIG